MPEAQAFDERVRARVRGGLIPDLRRLQFCDWFYNNPWRRPEFVDMVFGEYLRFALAHMQNPGARVLEVGSGPGHMSLELGRHGFHVTGLELSPASVEVARQTLAANTQLEGFGSVEYIQADFLSWQSEHRYDVVCFFLTLHHFDNPDTVLAKVASRLVPGGRIVVIEPAGDWFGLGNATVVALVRLLLARENRWYEALDLPQNESELAAYIQQCLQEYQLARDPHESPQSPRDNSSSATAILDALRSRFKEIAFRPGYAFVPRVVGGVRGPDETQVNTMAAFLLVFDVFCVRRGLLQPGAFFYAGTLPRESRPAS